MSSPNNLLQDCPFVSQSALPLSLSPLSVNDALSLSSPATHEFSRVIFIAWMRCFRGAHNRAQMGNRFIIYNVDIIIVFSSRLSSTAPSCSSYHHPLCRIFPYLVCILGWLSKMTGFVASVKLVTTQVQSPKCPKRRPGIPHRNVSEAHFDQHKDPHSQRNFFVGKSS